MINRLSVLVILALAVAAPAFAQQAPAAPPTPAGSLRNYYNGNKNNIIRSAEKMPEEFYGLRPGPQTEVRTFGQHVAHVAMYNYLWCSQAKNEKNPNAGKELEKTLTAKAEIVKVVTDSFAYCDSAYTALTDASGAEIVDITQENGRQVRQPRMGLLMLNVIHNNEVYGQLVALMRMKSIVPSSSEPRPAAPAPAPAR
jgi:uncharacterized damage-inducible protein DinB